MTSAKTDIKSTELTILLRDESPTTHFAMIPHLVDDADISIGAHRLYCHLKRITGEHGACWVGVRGLAKDCHLNIKTITKAKGELITAGFIRVTPQMIIGNGNRHPAHIITIVDIWKQNFKTYTQNNELVVKEATRVW